MQIGDKVMVVGKPHGEIRVTRCQGGEPAEVLVLFGERIPWIKDDLQWHPVGKVALVSELSFHS